MNDGDGLLRAEAEMIMALPQLVTAQEDRELGSRYLEWIPEYVPSFAYGIYLHDEETGRPRLSEVRGLSRFYVSRYERFGRFCDPVLQSALQQGHACDESSLMPAEDWARTQIVRELFQEHDMGHVMCAPLVRDGRVVGTINFARHAHEPPFATAERSRATAAASILAAALTTVMTNRSLLAERGALRAALDLCSQAVIVSDHERAERHVNAAARELLSALDRRELEPLLEADARGHAALATGSGPPATVAVTSHTLAGWPDIVVSTLDVEGSVPSAPPGMRRVLTAREIEIAELIAAGRRDREIAEHLLISTNTVKHHLKAIYSKLGVRSRAELTARMLR